MSNQVQHQQDLEILEIDGETFFKIENSDRLRHFFMSIVSASNHWMFIGSNGGLTAGRKNAEFSLFPYYSDDKIIESTEVTGPKTIVQVTNEGQLSNWEPFSTFGPEKFELTRNLYKNRYGNKLAFEEINHDLKLRFRYEWNSSNLYGFVRKAKLINEGSQQRDIRLLDGLQNILPYGVGSDLQMKQSNLVDAYKRNELDSSSGLGIFALSAIIVDRAEPSEALKANVAWQKGLPNPKYLVSSKQLPDFKAGKEITSETDVKAEKGAFFAVSELQLPTDKEQQWIVVADVNKNHTAVAQIISAISQADILDRLEEDIALGTQELIKLTASADGLQHTADTFKDVRHFANVMFNIMRGGVFDHNYQIEKWDLLKYLKIANHSVFEEHQARFKGLPELFELHELATITDEANDAALTRLLTEYLPLKFSRRHGDPSRPWNKFSINTRNEDDGSKILDYQGNWRDIFQNWEALAFAFPDFMEGMIFRFLNASTFDGYNPYRVMKHGFDWETIEPDDPWSFIGYWGDHQIIYLLKFLEFMQNHRPDRLKELLNQRTFAYAAVPYRIKSYTEILKNPKDSIEFDHEWDAEIRKKRAAIGSDGALLQNQEAKVYHVNFMEKILATSLSKISNLIPEAGIWMNTQRPEWNDANNALVGIGVSMVTLYYLRRFLAFFNELFDGLEDHEIEVSEELKDYFLATSQSLSKHKTHLSKGFSDADRKEVMDALGQSASDYREQIYEQGFSGKKSHISLQEVNEFYGLCQEYLEQSIEANRRTDRLYHTYNIIEINDEEVSVSFLSEMLEGQVAVLSSGYLSAQEVLELMEALRNSQLYRADQNSYILYPNKELEGFLSRNQVPAEQVERSALLKKLVADGNVTIIEKDVNGAYHFHGAIRNRFELDGALDSLDAERYAELIRQDRKLVHEIYEDIFDHKTFTGRSGTFFGYEGLGSIYWHMVSKLLLAVEECTLEAIEKGADSSITQPLTQHCRQVFEGIGVHKSPEVYGAFSIDPYSHTPYYKGAQQPGMTGQVKEDVISRILELGAQVVEGKLSFTPQLLDSSEFISTRSQFEYVDLDSNFKTIDLPEKSLAFTYCQVPIVYQLSGQSGMMLKLKNGEERSFDTTALDLAWSQKLFSRTGEIEKITVQV